MGLKTVKHLVRKKFDIDSVAYLYKNQEDLKYVISDRFSPVRNGEKPKAEFSLIKEGDRDHQIRIACEGDFHIEKPFYYELNPNEWRTWNWICVHEREIFQLKKFFEECLVYLNF